MIQPSTKRRERLLLYGGEGAGKTRAWCAIAAWYRRTGNPAQFHVLDSDVTVEAMADGWPDFYDNVTVYDVLSWRDYLDQFQNAKKAADPTRMDWLVVDRADLAWPAVQDYYVETVLEQDVENWVIAHAKGESKGQHPLSGEWGMNWFYINRMYQSFAVPLLRWPGHVFLTAAEKKLVRAEKSGDRSDDKDVLALYGGENVRPDGQKNLGHQMHTVIHAIDASTPRKPEWKMTTVKDREREKMSGKVISDFVLDYLVPVAKWEM